MKARLASAATHAALALALLAGCGHQASPGRAASGPDPQVAKVNAEAVFASDVDREARAQGLIGAGEHLAPSSAQFRQVLQEVEDSKLLAGEAQRQGLDRTPEGRRALADARERVLSDLLLQRTVKGALDEGAVRSLYAEMVKDTPPTDQIAIRQIVLPSEGAAAQIKAQLARGADFSALAASRSTDQATRLAGGVLPPMAPADLPPNYAGPLKSAKAGDIVGPFQTSGGWVVARVDARGPRAPESLDAARPRIVRFLTYNEIKNLVLDLRRRAKVEELLPPLAPGANAAPETPAAAGLKGETP
ncbi:MAG TPA: peptidylprolyl isomerase [Caulobacteraceae bacterium]|nr:peptidylprolyl isomerase [Caulobacteraceae bacterium]